MGKKKKKIAVKKAIIAKKKKKEKMGEEKPMKHGDSKKNPSFLAVSDDYGSDYMNDEEIEYDIDELFGNADDDIFDDIDYDIDDNEDFDDYFAEIVDGILADDIMSANGEYYDELDYNFDDDYDDEYYAEILDGILSDDTMNGDDIKIMDGILSNDLYSNDYDFYQQYDDQYEITDGILSDDEEFDEALDELYYDLIDYASDDADSYYYYEDVSDSETYDNAEKAHWHDTADDNDWIVSSLSTKDLDSVWDDSSEWESEDKITSESGAKIQRKCLHMWQHRLCLCQFLEWIDSPKYKCYPRSNEKIKIMKRTPKKKISFKIETTNATQETTTNSLS